MLIHLVVDINSLVRHVEMEMAVDWPIMPEKGHSFVFGEGKDFERLEVAWIEHEIKVTGSQAGTADVLNGRIRVVLSAVDLADDATIQDVEAEKLVWTKLGFTVTEEY
jgi:hypothetical protein